MRPRLRDRCDHHACAWARDDARFAAGVSVQGGAVGGVGSGSRPLIDHSSLPVRSRPPSARSHPEVRFNNTVERLYDL